MAARQRRDIGVRRAVIEDVAQSAIVSDTDMRGQIERGELRGLERGQQDAPRQSRVGLPGKVEDTVLAQ
jgi:hypothetical protein